MSTHNDHNDHNNQRPESAGIQAKPVLVFLGILTFATIVVFFLIQGLLFAFKKMDAAETTQPATRVALPEGQSKLPPEPRLQGAPGPEGPSLLPLEEMKVYREQVDQKAESYGWVDKTSGVAHIPIERAKELIAEKGLPVRSEDSIQEIQKAEAARKLILNSDANGGRVIKK